MSKKKYYSPEFKEEAVRLAEDGRYHYDFYSTFRWQ